MVKKTVLLLMILWALPASAGPRDALVGEVLGLATPRQLALLSQLQVSGEQVDRLVSLALSAAPRILRQPDGLDRLVPELIERAAAVLDERQLGILRQVQPTRDQVSQAAALIQGYLDESDRPAEGPGS